MPGDPSSSSITNPISRSACENTAASTMTVKTRELEPTAVATIPTPSSPMQIPLGTKPRAMAGFRQKQLRSSSSRSSSTSSTSINCTRRPLRTSRPSHVPSPSVAALLAVTSIPSRAPSRGRQPRHKRTTTTGAGRDMAVEAIVQLSHEPEKELSLSMGGRSPLEILLDQPDHLVEDTSSLCDSHTGSSSLTRTVSVESVPSLLSADTTCSIEVPPHTPSPVSSRRRAPSRPVRRSVEHYHPLSISPPTKDSHFASCLLGDGDDGHESAARKFTSLAGKEDGEDDEDGRGRGLVSLGLGGTFKPLRHAFRSNLTASLRALRQAARSFSGLTFTSVPPDDFLTRSIMGAATLDPHVPYADERRPPPLEEEPTAALRRYLNPTTTARLERLARRGPSGSTDGTAAGGGIGSSSTQAFTASIQMQTYKVYRARSASQGSRASHSSRSALSPSSSATGSAGSGYSSSPSHQPRPSTAGAGSSSTSGGPVPGPGPRQREMRENSDFIRIAVMEMAMRKRGKLDDQRPGRARWALPPRRITSRPYEIGPGGVPVRWVATNLH